MFCNFSVFPKSSKASIRLSGQAGFGLIEMLVAVGVMVIVMSVIMVRQSSFDSAVLLRSQAYEVALQAREIQLSAVSVTSDGSGVFRSVLGLYFNKTGTNDEGYKMFRDGDGDGYDATEMFGKQGRLDARFEIKDIIVDSTSRDDISVVFERPNFDARFFRNGAEILGVEQVEIVIGRRDSTHTRTVEITSTGQISVRN